LLRAEREERSSGEFQFGDYAHSLTTAVVAVFAEADRRSTLDTQLAALIEQQSSMHLA